MSKYAAKKEVNNTPDQDSVFVRLSGAKETKGGHVNLWLNDELLSQFIQINDARKAAGVDAKGTALIIYKKKEIKEGEYYPYSIAVGKDALANYNLEETAVKRGR